MQGWRKQEERALTTRQADREPVEQIRYQGRDGIELVADVAGPADGSPVLFLHGGGQTRQSWGRAIDQAARRGYRALTLDMRGHGESGWSPDGRYDMDRFANDVRAVIETMSGPPVIVGASMGGLTGLLVSAEPPPAIRALILVDVAVRLEETGTKEIGLFMKSAPEGFATPEEAADAVSAYIPHRPRPKNISGLMRNLRLREDGRYYWHWDPAFIQRAPDSARPDPELFANAARKLAIPTLLIRGGRSRVLSADGAAAFLDLAPHTELAVVPDADHMVAGDANDNFNELVFGFLARHTPVDARDAA